jgi:hypothetical protein
VVSEFRVGGIEEIAQPPFISQKLRNERWNGTQMTPHIAYIRTISS